MKTSLIILVLTLTLNLGVFGQTRVIEGVITTLNDLSVSNITVAAIKAGSSVRTDSMGRFVIVTHEKDVLEISSRNNIFDDAKVRINRRTPESLNIHVKFINTPENREMAVGYGFVKGDDLLNAVSQLDKDPNNYCSYSDIFALIRGKIPGVRVVGSGTDAEIFIRGLSSNNPTTALFVVDGLVTNSIAYLSPCFVKSIDVIKDASASIYGIRGGNGVILIETRTGDE